MQFISEAISACLGYKRLEMSSEDKVDVLVLGAGEL